MTGNRLALALGLTLAAAAVPAHADVYNFNTIQRGWYAADGYNAPTNENYIVGQLGDGVNPNILYHNFFAFAPLTGVTGTIVSIELFLFNPDAGFVSSQPSETYSLHGYAGDVAALIAGNETPPPGATTYADLVSGTFYGGGTVSAADNNTFIVFSLNAAAMAAIGSAGSDFAIGGQLTGIPVDDMTTRSLFSGTPFLDAGDGNTYLRVTTAPVTTVVPEPGSILLFGTVIGGILVARRKSLKKA